MNALSEEERVALFKQNFSQGTFKAKDFYNWHNILTGSCKFGRDVFVQQKGIDLESNMTVLEFINLTQNEYGSHIIKLLLDKTTLVNTH